MRSTRNSGVRTRAADPAAQLLPHRRQPAFAFHGQPGRAGLPLLCPEAGRFANLLHGGFLLSHFSAAAAPRQHRPAPAPYATLQPSAERSSR